MSGSGEETAASPEAQAKAGTEESFALAKLRADVARQEMRLAKDHLKRARKRFKEARRESRRARKLASVARRAWKRNKHRDKPSKGSGRHKRKEAAAAMIPNASAKRTGRRTERRARRRVSKPGRRRAAK